MSANSGEYLEDTESMCVCRKRIHSAPKSGVDIYGKCANVDRRVGFVCAQTSAVRQMGSACCCWPVPDVTVFGAVSQSGHCCGTVGRHSVHDDRTVCQCNSDSDNGISVLIYNRYFEI